VRQRGDRVVRFDVASLAPGTRYRFVVEVDGTRDRGRGLGTFLTPQVGAQSFTVTAGSCARTGSNGAVFDAIRAEQPLLHLALGDMHYENIESTDPARWIDAWGRALTTPAQSALARSVPMAYVWDDHDYGPNDAGATAVGRSAAREAYRRAAPHYDLAAGDHPINQAFSIGRVRFVLTDARSERTGSTVLGEAQLAWLFDELASASRSHAVVVWMNSNPWIGEADPTADGWAGVPGERERIGSFLEDEGIQNLVMVSGDAHMEAIDDGTNSGYAPGGGGGFPVLHAAPLDRPGNIKGGPYSHGAIAGAGQYGVIDVLDDGGDEVRVTLSGKSWDGRVLLTHEVRVRVPATVG
jgi:phosphodiesterase/alkaline phosphatase D-like protein